MNTNYPAIGFCPIIDSRRKGIRESLEEITMSLARSVVQFYTNTLKCPEGSLGVSYGHIGLDLITLASMLRILVCMHNVEEEDFTDKRR